MNQAEQKRKVEQKILTREMYNEEYFSEYFEEFVRRVTQEINETNNFITVNYIRDGKKQRAIITYYELFGE